MAITPVHPLDSTTEQTDTSHADANANEGLDHGIFKFNFIQGEVMVKATIQPHYIADPILIGSTKYTIDHRLLLR